MLLRQQIAADASPLRSVLESASFTDFFGALRGEQLSTAPKGFSKTHEEIDLLNYKQFLVRHNYSDREVLSPHFEEQVAEGFSRMRSFFDVMTEYLTTDLNGVSVV